MHTAVGRPPHRATEHKAPWDAEVTAAGFLQTGPLSYHVHRSPFTSSTVPDSTMRMTSSDHFPWLALSCRLNEEGSWGASIVHRDGKRTVATPQERSKSTIHMPCIGNIRARVKSHGR